MAYKPLPYMPLCRGGRGGGYQSGATPRDGGEGGGAGPGLLPVPLPPHAQPSRQPRGHLNPTQVCNAS